MAALLMTVVLYTSNRTRLAPYTTYLMGLLITSYVLFLAPVSGFSINPARTVGSAVWAHVYTALWVYFVPRHCFRNARPPQKSYLRLTRPHDPHRPTPATTSPTAT